MNDDEDDNNDEDVRSCSLFVSLRNFISIYFLRFSRLRFIPERLAFVDDVALTFTAGDDYVDDGVSLSGVISRFARSNVKIRKRCGSRSCNDGLFFAFLCRCCFILFYFFFFWLVVDHHHRHRRYHYSQGGWIINIGRWIFRSFW